MTTKITKKIRIGYISSVAVTPLLVAVHKVWFADLDLSVDLVPQIGWTSLTRKLGIGSLQGAIVPLALPVAAASAKNEQSINFMAGIAMGFGGASLVGSKALTTDPNFASTREEIRYGTSGTLEPDLHFARSWQQKSSRDMLEKKLRTIPITSTQKIEFLAENIIDLHFSIEPWITISEKRGIGEPILTGAPYENAYPNRVLVLNSEWVNHNPNTYNGILAIFDRATKWIEDERNGQELLSILKGQEWSLEDSEILGLFYSPERRFRLRPDNREGLALTQQDLFAAWQIYCMGKTQPNREAMFSVPKWASNTFKLRTPHPV